MQLSKSEQQRYRNAISIGQLHVAAAPLESIGSLISGSIPRLPPPYTCSLCGRSGLRDWNAAAQHVTARHAAEFMRTSDGPVAGCAVGSATASAAVAVVGDVDSMFETALIRIANSASLDEATGIATDALLGRTESDEVLHVPCVRRQA